MFSDKWIKLEMVPALDSKEFVRVDVVQAKSRKSKLGFSASISLFVLSSFSLLVFVASAFVLFALTDSNNSKVKTNTHKSMLVSKVDKTTWLERINFRNNSRLQGKINFIANLVSRSGRRREALSLARAIVEESEKHRIDPLLVAALVKVESSFNAQAVSRKGARGLMQVKPSTALFLSNRLEANAFNFSRGDLHLYEKNLGIGIRYIKYLMKSFNFTLERALMAYNWGPNNLVAALHKNANIPASVQNYANSVIGLKSAWQEEYSANWSMHSS